MQHRRLLNLATPDVEIDPKTRVKMLNIHHASSVFEDGMIIGKSHSIVVRPTAGSIAVARRDGNQIIVLLPDNNDILGASVQRIIHDEVISAIRIEARSYLPRRLAYLADKHNYTYQRLRFSHASGRWGSCSSRGTISLNIALMRLPFELIDYVIIHELSHTVEMNHSENFWNLVGQGDPIYKQHRRQLKDESPAI